MLAAVMLGIPALAEAVSPAPITGTWITQDQRGIVRIGTCGNVACGTIIGTGPALAHISTTPLDTNNTNPRLRGRPLVGIALIPEARREGDHWSGQIYAPREGRLFPATFNTTRDGKLRIKGCFWFICHTEIWQPVSQSGGVASH